MVPVTVLSNTIFPLIIIFLGLFHLVRGFDSDNITHVEGTIDPIRDISIIHLELRLKDMEQVNALLSKHKNGKKNNSLSISQKIELQVLEKVRRVLEDQDTDVRLVDENEWTKGEVDVVNRLQLLTAKPMVYLVNLSEEEAVRSIHLPIVSPPSSSGASVSLSKFEYLRQSIHSVRPHDVVIGYSGELEEELAVLEDEGERNTYLKDIALKYNVPYAKSMIPDIICAGYRGMGLCHYYTCGPEEVRAWTGTCFLIM